MFGCMVSYSSGGSCAKQWKFVTADIDCSCEQSPALAHMYMNTHTRIHTYTEKLAHVHRCNCHLAHNRVFFCFSVKKKKKMLTHLPIPVILCTHHMNILVITAHLYIMVHTVLSTVAAKIKGLLLSLSFLIFAHGRLFLTAW